MEELMSSRVRSSRRVVAIETDNNLKDPTEHTEKAIHFVNQHEH